MKTWPVIAFAVICSVALSGQESFQTASGANARVEGPNVYKLGGIPLIVHVHLPRAPNLGGGEVRATIANTEPRHPMQYDSPEEKWWYQQHADLKDGVADYDILFPITPYLKSGEWKLQSVEIGHGKFVKVDVPATAAFEIDSNDPAIKVALSGPSRTVVNGDKLKLHVKVDGAATAFPVKGCKDLVFVIFHPSGTPLSGAEEHEIQFRPGVVSEEDIFFERPPDAEPIGHWIAELTSRKDDRTDQPLRCPRSRRVDGQTFAFDILPAKDLFVPTSAEVILNPSEVQLLRFQATSLQRQIEDLQTNLSQGTQKETKGLLREAIEKATQNLDATEREFLSLEKSPIQPENSAAFFDDLRTSYREVEAQVNAELQQPPGFMLVAGKKPGMPRIARPVLNVMQQNRLAYSVAADNQTIYFDLEVSSVPPGAKVSYRRRGDQFKNAPNLTNCTLKSLVWAVWTLHFEEAGYESVDIEHNPYQENNHTVAATLKPKK